MSIKSFLILATLFLCGCQNLKIEGEYTYSEKETSSHLNSVVISYTNVLGDVPIVVKGKVNHDPIHRDKPSYQETSIEYWFW